MPRFPIRPTHRPSGPGLFANPTRLVIGVLVAVRLLIGVAVAQGQFVTDPDVTRFHQIATSEGRPYRDFEVEYAPVETIAIELLATGDQRSTAVRLAVVALVCDLLAFIGIWYGWGRRTAALYLLIGIPLVPFIYLRLDPLVVALAVWGLALARRGRERMGGVALAVGALTKLWPLVVAPAFVTERRGRATRWFLGLFAVGVTAWVAFGGIDGIRQVLSFRGATGWEVESTIGSIVWLITGGPIRQEAGANRTGMIPGWSRAMLLALLVAALLAIWARARQDDVDPAGGPALAAVAALLALSPLFSLQYALWIAPWSAVAWTDPRTSRWGRLGFVWRFSPVCSRSSTSALTRASGTSCSCDGSSSRFCSSATDSVCGLPSAGSRSGPQDALRRSPPDPRLYPASAARANGTVSLGETLYQACSILLVDQERGAGGLRTQRQEAEE